MYVPCTVPTPGVLKEIGRVKGIRNLSPKFQDISISRHLIDSITSKDPRTKQLAHDCLESMLSPELSMLGYPSATTQSSYYPNFIKTQEVRKVSEMTIRTSIGVENTRILRRAPDDQELAESFDVLQASIEQDAEPRIIGNLGLKKGAPVRVVRGDHSSDLAKVAEAISRAANYCSDDTRKELLQRLRETFLGGDFKLYEEALKLWVQDPVLM